MGDTRRYRMHKLSRELDRTGPRMDTPDSVGREAYSVTNDETLLAIWKSAETCGCGRCRRLADRQRSALYPPEPTLMGAPHPAWSQWLHAKNK